MIGNVPFADVKLEYGGQKLSLHDFFFAKSIDALKPGGVLALVTSHYTLDKQNAALREHLAEKADFLGAIRLPSDAFRREGTAVVTDIVFLRNAPPAIRRSTQTRHGWKPSRLPSRAPKFPSTAIFCDIPRWCWGVSAAKTGSTTPPTASSPTAIWPRSSAMPSGVCRNLLPRRRPR